MTSSIVVQNQAKLSRTSKVSSSLLWGGRGKVARRNWGAVGYCGAVLHMRVEQLLFILE